jgi:ribosome maturation factor RimP
MIADERVKNLAIAKVKELGGFLVSAKVNTQNVISVFVDKANGISISECLQISRFIEQELDREIEDFELSVSSPGLSKPFVVKEQYQKNIGKEIVVKLSDGKKVKGRLIAFDGDIILETNKKEKGKKQIKKETKIILSEQVKETKLVIKF